jgi:hypothetical protein
MEPENSRRYPEGHFRGLWTGIGIAIFSGVGIALSIVTRNYGLIGIGPAVGVAFGLSVGQAIENKYKAENRIRPLTEEEKRRKNIAVMAGLALCTLGVLVFLSVFLSRI